MVRFGINLTDRMYTKNEVEALLNKVIDGMIIEQTMKINYDIEHSNKSNESLDVLLQEIQ